MVQACGVSVISVDVVWEPCVRDEVVRDTGWYGAWHRHAVHSAVVAYWGHIKRRVHVQVRLPSSHATRLPILMKSGVATSGLRIETFVKLTWGRREERAGE